MRSALRGPAPAILALIAVLAVACTPSGAASPVATSAPSLVSGSTGPSGSTTTGQPVTLEWYSALNENEPYVADYKKIIASYQALHPNVTIHVTWMGRQLSTKIRPLLQ